MKKIVLILAFILNTAFIFAQYEVEYKTRADQVINYVADSYKWDASGWYDCNSPSDYGKYNWMIPVACFEKYGVTNTKGNQYLPHFNTTACLWHRFHFNLLGETYIFAKYCGAPSVKQNVLAYLTAAWARDDSYNLWTCEGTENHINMTRPAGYIYAKIALDSFPSSFPDAQEKLDSAKKWIMGWSKTIYEVGVSEWNSSTYGMYNIGAWFALYDWAEDAEVKLAAKAVLDYYACELALHYTQGITGGYESRNGSGYESIVTWSDYLGWLWFGESPKKILLSGGQNVAAATCVYAAASTYRPPMTAVKIGKKKLTKDAMYYNSKGEYSYNNPSAVKQTFYIGKTYTLGAAYLPYGGFTGTGNQFQCWKFVGKVAPDTSVVAKTANLVVGYGSGASKNALGRQPWDQFVHHKNVLIQMTKVPLNCTTLTNSVQALVNQWKIDYVEDIDQRFPTESYKNNSSYVNANGLNGTSSSYMAVWKKNATVSTVTNSNILFFTMDSNYLAVRSIAQSAPTLTTVTDNYNIVDAVSQGNICGLIIEIGSKLDYASFTAFQNNIITNASLDKVNIATGRLVYTSAVGDIIDVQYNSSGSFSEALVDWGYGPTVPQLFQTSPPFIGPTWPSGEGCGRIATWSVNSILVDLTSKWGVYEGNHFSLKNSKLRLDDGAGDTLLIDYTGAVPVYNPTFVTLEKLSAEKSSIKVYPIPSNGVVTIETTETNHLDVEVFTLTGQCIKNVSIGRNSIEIDFSNEEKGVFVMKVSDGVSITTEKVIIH